MQSMPPSRVYFCLYMHGGSAFKDDALMEDGPSCKLTRIAEGTRTEEKQFFSVHLFYSTWWKPMGEDWVASTSTALWLKISLTIVSKLSRRENPDRWTIGRIGKACRNFEGLPTMLWGHNSLVHVAQVCMCIEGAKWNSAGNDGVALW